MNNLKDQLIRLGNKHPELRKHIRPVLEQEFKSIPKNSKNKKAVDIGASLRWPENQDWSVQLEHMKSVLHEYADHLEFLLHYLPEDWDDVDVSEDDVDFEPGAAILDTAKFTRKSVKKCLRSLYKQIKYLESEDF